MLRGIFLDDKETSSTSWPNLDEALVGTLVIILLREETWILTKVYNKECIGGGNLNSIGIESCVYQGVDFNMVMRRLAKLTAMLLITYHLTSKDVKQHYDFSGKKLPTSY